MLDHRLDRRGDVGLVGGIGQGEDRVAHHQGRLGRVQHDDRLALFGAPYPLDGARRGLGEFVDIGPRPRTCRFRGDRGDDLGIAHPGDAVDGGDDGNGRLAAAGHHVDVAGGELGVEIDHRHHIGADRRRGQVDQGDAGKRLQLGVVRLVRLGGGGVEDDPHILELRHRQQPVDAAIGGGNPHPPGTGQTVRGGVDADHRLQFQRLGQAQDLDHQIRSDIARADDRAADFAHLDPQ